MKKIMLIYPPGKLYQRGEDRSQGNIEDSSATSMRAPNDLGYAASTLEEKGFDTFLKDYQSESLDLLVLKDDFINYDPDFLYLSITNSTIFSDLEIVKELKEIKESVNVILKGALFYNPDDELLDQLNLSNVSYLIGGESDFVIANLIDSHYKDSKELSQIRGILYKENSAWIRTDFDSWEKNLDLLDFPNRGKINNNLYVRPDTGEAQATIITSRGCPSKCVFCLTPTISGTKLRLRSPENIYEEMSICYEKHNIKNFFFRSDTFTIDRRWVERLCNLIINSNLHKKIEWVANSKVKPLEKETLIIMKEAGCWLVAFGYESGSAETMEKIKKGCSIEDNIQASIFAKEAKLKTFGFFLIGLPWENQKHLDETKNLMFELDSDFVELHLAVPYYGTPLYEMAKKEGLIDDTVLGKDYFNSPTVGTKYLSMDEIENFKKKVLLEYHMRPFYIMRRLKDALGNKRIFKNYAIYGSRLISKNITGLFKSTMKERNGDGNLFDKGPIDLDQYKRI